MIHGGQPARIESGRDPEAAGRSARRVVVPPGAIRFRLPERFELGGCRAARAHELHFVEHPRRVLVQEGELRRPERARRGVAAHQCTAQQHVLGTDEHRRTLRVVEPAVGVLAAHEHVHVLGPGEAVVAVRFRREAAEPLPDGIGGLLDQRPHGQAPDQPPGRGAGAPQAVRGPAERDRRGLARARRCHQHTRPCIGRQRELPRVRLHVLAEHDSIDGGAVHGTFFGGS